MGWVGFGMTYFVREKVCYKDEMSERKVFVIVFGIRSVCCYCFYLYVSYYYNFYDFDMGVI